MKDMGASFCGGHRGHIPVRDMRGHIPVRDMGASSCSFNYFYVSFYIEVQGVETQLVG